MSTEPASLSPEVQAGVDGYAERLTELLEACARHQEGDAEVFLWSARRALEAMVLLLHTVMARRVVHMAKDTALASMIHQLHEGRVLSREDRIRFDRAREYANLGVHIRQPEREDYPKAREDLSHLLPGIVDWLLDESIAAPYLHPSQRLLAALRDLRPDAPPPARITLTLPTPAAPPERPTRLLGGMVGAAALVVGSAMAVSMWHGGVAAEVEAPPVVAVAKVVQPAAEVPETQEPEPAPACPAGMVGVAGSIFRIGQPQGGRKDWPPPASDRPLLRRVASFCIDAEERSLSQVWAWAGSGLPVDEECSWQEAPAGPEAPAVCLDRDQAAAYCAAVVPGGRLPRLLEWEAVARLSEDVGIQRRVHREWIADDFPPEVLERRDPAASGHMFRKELLTHVEPEGNVLFSWNRQEPGNRWSNLGFRCASDPPAR